MFLFGPFLFFILNKNKRPHKMSEKEWKDVITAIEENSIEDFLANYILPPKLYQKANAGYTPLMLAVQKNRPEMIKAFLQIPELDINYKTKQGNALTIAVTKKNETIIKLLLEHGADPKQTIGKRTLFQNAQLIGASLNILEMLIQAGADIQTPSDGLTPLDYAISSQNIRLIEVLLKAGANPNTNTRDIEPSIFKAIDLFSRSKDPLPIVDLLLKYGADININSVKYFTPLHYFCSKFSNGISLLSFFEFLLERGADATYVSPYGDSVLHILCDSFNAEAFILRILDEPNLEINGINNIGLTPLMMIVRMKSSTLRNQVFFKMVKYPGIDINHQTNAGNALMLATDFYKHELLKLPELALTTKMQYVTVKQSAFNRSAILKSTIELLHVPIGITKDVKTVEDLINLDGVESLVIPPLNISELPILPESLVYLQCSNNPISILPSLPSRLRVLLCANCGLRSLPDLPDSLEYLDARDNRLLDIAKLPPKLFIVPIRKTNNSNSAIYSTNLLLTGNPLPIGFLNGFGSITQYNADHIHRVIHFKGDVVKTMILPKGTILFRDISEMYIGEEIKGIQLQDKQYFMYPEFNVFFYPYPFVAEHTGIVDTQFLAIFELVRDVEVVMGVSPSKNSREDRLKSDYLTSCNKIPTGNNTIEGRNYDPCFVREFSNMHPTINGLFVLATGDVEYHLRNNPTQRFWSKYRTNFKDERAKLSEVGVPEIILHPYQNRFDSGSPLNYKYIRTLKRTPNTYDNTWRFVETNLQSGTWTIDLFTKLYVNYESASDEVKSRCAPPEEPHKLHYLNYSYWNIPKIGGRHLPSRKGKRPLKYRRTRKN